MKRTLVVCAALAAAGCGFLLSLSGAATSPPTVAMLCARPSGTVYARFVPATSCAAGDARINVSVPPTTTAQTTTTVAQTTTTQTTTPQATTTTATVAQPTGTANVWVSTSGNDATCGRSSTPVSLSAPCATVTRAFQLAACGDTIDIAPGDYSGIDQRISGGPAGCSTPVVIQSGSGNRADVKLGQVFSPAANVYSGGASWWTLQHVTVLNRVWVAHASHVTLNDVDGGDFYWNQVSDSTIEWSDWGPCTSDNTETTTGCSDPAKLDVSDNENILIAHNVFHDWDYTVNHTTCLALWGGNNITVDSNSFSNCAIFGIEVSSNGPGDCGTGDAAWTWSNWLLENNTFGRITQGDNVTATPNAVTFTHGAVWKNFQIKGNTFTGVSGITDTSEPQCAQDLGGVTVAGNTGAFEGCVGAVTYQNNVWAGGTCSATDRSG